MSYTPVHRTPEDMPPADGPSRRRPGWLHLSTWSRRSKFAASIIGALMAGSVAFAATTWTVGLGSNSSGQAQSGSVTNLTITASASPTPGNLLYPGATGDVVATITNPNSIPVTVTAVQLPTNTTYAVGFSNSTLTTAQTGCDATASYVSWTDATATSGSSHTLASPITVGANGSVTATFTSEAAMGTSAANACQNTYFKMPSLTGVTASAGAGTATTSPATDSWS